MKWAKLLSITGGAQLIIQGTGFIGGILVIRLLSVEEYAFYTLVNTMLGTMTVLADGGISTGVMSEGGKVWNDRNRLGAILATGMHMRRQFAIGSLLVSLPILFYLLNEQGLIWWQSVILIACLTPTFWAALSGSLLQIVPRLHQDINQLLKINIGVNVARLAVLLPTLFIFPFAGVAILAAGVSQVGGNIQLRKLSLKNADWKQSPDPEYRQKIMGTVKKVLPGSIYYCISGQITIWLIAIFSDTEGIAQIGALGRLMMVLTLVRLMIDMLIVPRYARLKPQKKLIIIRFFQVLMVVAVIAISISSFVYLFPDECLWILGNKYADLQHEIFLMTVSSCLAMVTGTTFMMATSRAIIPSPYFFIFFTIISQASILFFLVDYTTVAGVIQFSIYSAIANITYRIIHFLKETILKKDWPAETEPLKPT